MTKRILFLLSALFMPVACWAAVQFSAASKMRLMTHSPHSCKFAAARDSASLFQAFIQVSDDQAIHRLRDCDVTVNGRFDGFVTASVPVHALANLADIDGVDFVSFSQPLHLCNDSARYLSLVNPLHTAENLIAPLTGRGVIVGMIDVGIDFNHINLCDEKGKSRVKAVYLPCDDTGTAPVVNDEVLPGSCYETPEQIAALTTDFSGSSHGTHTTGTAAGGYLGNDWYGIAPQADIVACGMPDDQLTDVNIVNAVKYIFNYANRVGKPCVINMSIASNGGPNDGSSFLCKSFESLSEPGRICVVAAGNDGNAPIRFSKTMMGVGDTVTTLLRNQWGGMNRKGFVSMWSEETQEHRTRVVIMNRSTHEIEYTSPVVGFLPEDSVYTLSHETDEFFGKYYQGEIQFASALEPSRSQERFHSYWLFDVTSVESGHLIGLQYVVDEPSELVGWCSKQTYFYTFGIDGITGGSSAGSISDMATTDSVISVGAYCSRRWVSNDQGVIDTDASCVPTDIAYFSSYGPDELDVSRPDVCAPGLSVVSSANRYDEKADRNRWMEPAVVDGVEYPYYSNKGTSMSAPVVSGLVALMLQVNPGLTPSAAREALISTAYKDSFVLSGDASRWGGGKVDGMSAIEAVLRNTFLKGDVNGDDEVNISDIMSILDIILCGSRDDDALTMIRCDVNCDREILFSDINEVIDLLLE